MQLRPPKFLTSRARRALATTLVALALPASASAQAPAINWGRGVQLRLYNSNRYDSDAERNVGQTKLIVNTLVEGPSDVPVLVTLEQGGRALARGSCRTEWVHDQSMDGARVAELRECSTETVDAATIRANQPVDVVLSVVNEATDARTEFYRGTFPVIAFYEWTGMSNGRPVYVEQRSLRVDSMYGVAYVFQDKPEVDFTYVTTTPTQSLPDEYQMRCRVGNGQWSVYESRLSRGNEQDLVNRVHVDEYTIAEENQRIVTQYVNVGVWLPVAVAGRDRTPDAGSSLDGAWTCELRVGGLDRWTVEREFRFDVRGGYIQSHAIAGTLPPGHGSALVAIGFGAASSLPMIIDPVLVRDTIAGRAATAPVLGGLPSRARNPQLVMPRGGGASGGRGRRR